MASKDLKDTVKPIQDAWSQIVTKYESLKPGYTLQITCTYRSPDEQYQLYLHGRVKGADGKIYVHNKKDIVTNADGRTDLSAHNTYPSRAIDVAVRHKETGKITWEDRFYEPLGVLAEQQNLDWGGRWKSFKDMPHIQVKKWKEYVEG